jgi:hypothetical protein
MLWPTVVDRPAGALEKLRVRVADGAHLQASKDSNACENCLPKKKSEMLNFPRTKLVKIPRPQNILVPDNHHSKRPQRKMDLSRQNRNVRDGRTKQRGPKEIHKAQTRD